MLVTDHRLLGARALTQVVAEAIAGGVNVVQLRAREIPAGQLLTLARELRAIVQPPNMLLVNDRLDVALAAGADGVELGTGALPVADARRIAPGLMIGRSIHSVSEAVEAANAGADFCIAGTMFATQSHPGKSPEGPALMGTITSTVGLPIIAIGGITPTKVPVVLEAGAVGVAVISDIMAAADPRAAAAALWRALNHRL